MEPTFDLTQQLEGLEKSIALKRTELEAQGVLHGPEREAAAEMHIRSATLRQRLETAPTGSGSVASEIARDVEILKGLFEKWGARTDRLSEGR